MIITSDSPGQTLMIGKKLAENLRNNDIICLFGDLGSGKTLLTKGIAQGLGVEKNSVISPSFLIVKRHEGRKLSLNHFDLYRLEKPDSILSLGYEEYFYDEAVTVVEWAERMGGFLPQQYLKVELSIKGNTKRVLKFSGIGSRYLALLGRLRGILLRK